MADSLEMKRMRPVFRWSIGFRNGPYLTLTPLLREQIF